MKTPYSAQIFRGTDAGNSLLGAYKRQQANATGTQEVSVFFDDLHEGTTYTAFFTASAALPYRTPVNLYEDFQVVNLTFTTPPNPNLNFNEVSILESVKQINPGLASALMDVITQKDNQQPSKR